MDAKRASGHAVVTALDIGAGSGLLSMMAARCAGMLLSMTQDLIHSTAPKYAMSI